MAMVTCKVFCESVTTNPDPQESRSVIFRQSYNPDSKEDKKLAAEIPSCRFEFRTTDPELALSFEEGEFYTVSVARWSARKKHKKSPAKVAAEKPMMITKPMSASSLPK